MWSNEFLRILTTYLKVKLKNGIDEYKDLFNVAIERKHF